MGFNLTFKVLKYPWQMNYGMNNQDCELSYVASKPLYAFMLMGSAVSLVDTATR